MTSASRFSFEVSSLPLMLVHYGETAADYLTDVLAARAEETIAEAVSHQPFFLSIATKAPHGEGARVTGFPNPQPAPRHLNAFSSEPLPQPASFNEPDVSDKPAPIQALPLLTEADINDITGRYRSRLASLLAVDD